jgi:hypothetical protein
MKVSQIIGILALCSWCSFSRAQVSSDPAPKPSETDQVIPEKMSPATSSPVSPTDSAPLSEKLQNTDGTLKPSPNIDPGMAKSPTSGAKDGAIIPAPGSPGGRKDVNPK